MAKWKRDRRGHWPKEAKDACIAYAKKHGVGGRVTAIHFGIPQSAVQYWITQARESGELPPPRKMRRSNSSPTVAKQPAPIKPGTVADLETRKADCDAKIAQLEEDKATIDKMIALLERDGG